MAFMVGALKMISSRPTVNFVMMQKGDSHHKELGGSPDSIERSVIRSFVWIIREYLGRELYNQCQIPPVAAKEHTEFLIAIP
jgi:hypothetical protein